MGSRIGGRTPGAFDHQCSTRTTISAMFTWKALNAGGGGGGGQEKGCIVTCLCTLCIFIAGLMFLEHVVECLHQVDPEG